MNRMYDGCAMCHRNNNSKTKLIFKLKSTQTWKLAEKKHWKLLLTKKCKASSCNWDEAVSDMKLEMISISFFLYTNNYSVFGTKPTSWLYFVLAICCCRVKKKRWKKKTLRVSKHDRNRWILFFLSFFFLASWPQGSCWSTEGVRISGSLRCFDDEIKFVAERWRFWFEIGRKKD